ncbi:WD-40 repeat-containing protein [Flammula alnicola]|nr:WD-40 repeat-containing protein [Flammula alnicola]
MANPGFTSTSPPPPTPLHLLRSHSSSISAVAFSDDNERIYSADTSGKVVVTSTRSLRSIAVWNAHTDSILGVEEWDKFIVTHGRDNKVHVWQRIEELPLDARIGGSAGLPSLPTPTLCYSMDVNALNFCRFSLLKLPKVSEENAKPKALIALPNLVDSSTADVWSLPLMDRVHAAIGQEVKKSVFSANPGGRNNSGIMMSVHLYHQKADATSSSASARGSLRILAAYENGSVVLREYTRSAKEVSIEGEGWEIIWKSKLHVDSIMAMRVSRANEFAVTVSADHIVGRYDLTVDKPPPEEHGVAHRTKHAGNGSVAIRDNGKVCAVGGWDGKVRLYSTKSFKPLGTLKYHKSACQCVDAHDDEDDEMTSEEKAERCRWLIAGAKDNRISIWSLMSFEK